MFFSLFWTAYIPICMIILALAGEQLMRSFRRLGAHAWIASSNRAESGAGGRARACSRVRPANSVVCS